MAQAIQAPLPPNFFFGENGKLQYNFDAIRKNSNIKLFDAEHSPFQEKSLPALPVEAQAESSTDEPQTGVQADTLSILSDFEVPSFNTSFQLDGLTLADLPQRPFSQQITQPPPAKLRISIPKDRPARPRTWFPGLQSADQGFERSPIKAESPVESPKSAGDKAEARKSASGFANLARRSFLYRGGSTKSTSTASTASASIVSPQETDDDQTLTDISSVMSSKRASRASTYFGRGKDKQTLLSKVQELTDSEDSCASSADSLRHRGAESVDSHTWSESTMTTPTTDDAASADMPVRDPLWTVFKKLDIDAQCFPEKQMAQKIAQLQNQVLPFLRSTASHPSIKTLQPDEVDQRATILDKWWGAILDMLDDNNNPAVPGVDRPTVLEAATMLMMRPEWRKATSYFQPLDERSPMERVRAGGSDGRGDWTFEELMVAESAEHSVRTMFIANLVRQMAFVVEKMSLRHAPLTLVNFAGKTCAYAFFFAPGVADVLVRLWSLTPDLIRRVADEMKLPRKDSGESDDIVALFPPKLGVFGWSTPRTLWNTIKQVPKMSVMIARIPWTGAWVTRWKGRDTDLFFIFCKYYHILCDQFMPTELPLVEKARSPAFVLVQAQLLNILDATVHRQATMANAVQFDSGADASAMPLTVGNSTKSMAENRTVVLLKDVLTDDSPENIGARHTFAQAYASLLKATALRTSKYNNGACISICDLLEEAFNAYDAFEVATGKPAYNDWDFWTDAFQRMMSSLNTLSEVRMLAFLFSIWNVAGRNPARRLALCRDWLLTPETFNSLFNNWCPMVRAYYHRLLCWRICRDENPSEVSLTNAVDREIYLLATQRLKTVWSHYLYLKDAAAENGRLGPSTMAMSPVLGKRFIIIRQEVNSPQAGVIMGFDAFARTSSLAAVTTPTSPAAAEVVVPLKSEQKKRWSLFGKVLARAGANSPEFMAMDLPRNKSFDDKKSASVDLTRQRHSLAVINTSLKTPAAKGADSPASAASPLTEGQMFVFRFVLGWQQQQTMAQRERTLFTPQLPGPAQMRLGGGTPVARPNAGESMPVMPSQTLSGLINGARNSDVLEERLQQLTNSVTPLSGPSMSSSRQTSRPGSRAGTATDKSETETMLNYVSGQLHDAPTLPLKPAGIFAQNAVYSGQALAEWAQVVSECNSFISRRCDEGVARLADVEVPQLGMEGFRKLGG